METRINLFLATICFFCLLLWRWDLKAFVCGRCSLFCFKHHYSWWPASSLLLSRGQIGMWRSKHHRCTSAGSDGDHLKKCLFFPAFWFLDSCFDLLKVFIIIIIIYWFVLLLLHFGFQTSFSELHGLNQEEFGESLLFFHPFSCLNQLRLKEIN